MSDAVRSVPALPEPDTAALLERQLGAVFALELRRTFLGARSLLVYLLAAAAPALFTLVALVARRPMPLASIPQAYATIFFFELRMVVFFGCAWVFASLVRGEVLDRSLHYAFLSPIRRELLVVGKFLAGLFGTVLLFGASTLLARLALYLGHGPRILWTAALTGDGLGQTLDYFGTTAFACLGYGALFLALGLAFRNPFVPALVFWGWEWLHYLLPPALKSLTVIHYLQSLSPLPFEQGTFALLAEPVSPAAAVAGLLAGSTLLVAGSAWWVRTMEIAYTRE